jgi:hypothetical protein
MLLGLSVACGPAVRTTPVPVPSAGTPIRYASRPDSTRFAKATLVSLDEERMVFERYEMEAAGRRGAWTRDSLSARTLAALQVRVGRRSNLGRGALIGAAVGLGLGFVCAGEEGELVSAEQCVGGYTLLGAGAGALIGLLVRSDVWAPVALPAVPVTPSPVTRLP